MLTIYNLRQIHVFLDIYIWDCNNFLRVRSTARKLSLSNFWPFRQPRPFFLIWEFHDTNINQINLMVYIQQASEHLWNDQILDNGKSFRVCYPANIRENYVAKIFTKKSFLSGLLLRMTDLRREMGLICLKIKPLDKKWSTQF